MPKEIVALDVDDVLFPCSARVCEYHNETYGTSLKPADFYVTDLHEVFGCSPEEERRRMHIFDHEGHTQIGEPLAGALEAVAMLRKRYDLVVVTSRPVTAEEQTLNWLDAYFPNTFAQVQVRVCGNHYGNCTDFVPKPIACKELGAVALVDDQVRHAMACAEDGMQAILFGDYAWNQLEASHPNLRRALDWAEVCKFLL
jgi:5'(3')-deoxyribonucleotidase